jgi:hypothetical protein
MNPARNGNISVSLVLFILACVFFAFAGGAWWAAPDWPWRNRLLAWGLFCWAVSTRLPW